MNRQRMALPLFAVIAIGGCAVASVEGDFQAHRQATSCCASDAELPGATTISEKATFSLQPSSPHYDFGGGLGPFARYNIEPTRWKYVTLLSKPRGSGKAFGGDGTFHYVDVRPLFYDLQGKRLADVALSEPKMRLYGFAGHYMYERIAEVPAAAKVMVLASTDSSAGDRGQIAGMGASGGVAVGSMILLTPAREETAAYTRAVYGDGVVLLSVTAPDP